MVKAILIGNQTQLHQIGNRFLPGGIPVEITDAESKKHSDVVLFCGDEVVLAKIEKIPIIEKEEVKPQKYTEKELLDMNKSEQVEILKLIGITKIPPKEVDRVKAILEAQQ